MRRGIVLLILVGLVVFIAGCKKPTTKSGISGTPSTQTVPKK